MPRDEPRRPATIEGRRGGRNKPDSAEQAETAIERSRISALAGAEEAGRNRRVPKVINPFKIDVQFGHTRDREHEDFPQII